MHLVIARIGNDPTVKFAFEELVRLLKTMDPLTVIDGRVYPAYTAAVENVIWLGYDGSVAESALDAIRIDVKNGVGVITGSGSRAVLLAAYRFAVELGCSFLRPGRSGEIIPRKPLTKELLTVSVAETASYRHRGVCIEGAVSYEHVANMIDFLPKVGMNAYFMQFHTPGTFFMRYYNENPNPNVQTHPVTDEDVAHMWMSIEAEIEKRGLDYHATGHGWTCEPFGIHSVGWYKQEDSEMPPEALAVMAELNGHRGLYKGIPLDTNLCYSNPAVREKMNNAIVDYCRAHPSVNFLHFWLADGTNNHCECDECRKKTPADYYVQMLNELDEKLTAAGIATKIVCLIYVDLLWAPEHEKIANPDRFVLMFAPITRSYTTAFADADRSEPVELVPYKRNQNVMPHSVAENLARLEIWQREQLSGDSFDFDYHLMWDHHYDPGYYECARVLHTDMANLDKIGLHGMISCQLQRTFFPTGLPFYAMARALWDKTSDFADVCADYFKAAFGEDAKTVETYLSALSADFDPAYLRCEKPSDPQGYAAKLRAARKRIDNFACEVLAQKDLQASPWRFLSVHAELAKEHADLLEAYRGPDTTPEKREAAKKRMLACLWDAEDEIGEAFDSFIFEAIFGRLESGVGYDAAARDEKKE